MKNFINIYILFIISFNEGCLLPPDSYKDLKTPVYVYTPIHIGHESPITSSHKEGDTRGTSISYETLEYQVPREQRCHPILGEVKQSEKIQQKQSPYM